MSSPQSQHQQDLSFSSLDYKQWILSRISNKSKSISIRTLLSSLLSTISHFLLSLLLFIPKLIIISSPTFNQHFKHLNMHAILSESEISEVVEIGKEFNVPILVIILPASASRYQRQYKIVQNILTDHNTSQFLNQSFITSGVLIDSREQRELKSKINSYEVDFEEEGLYFLRNSGFEDLECYGRIGLGEQEIQSQKLIEKIKVMRKKHCQRNMVEQRIIKEIQEKGRTDKQIWRERQYNMESQ